jgi:hypothetical protein
MSGGLTHVKKIVSLLIAVAFVAGTTGFAFAQAPSTTPMPKAEDKKMDKSAEKKMGEKKMSSKSAKGAVKSASADSVVVAGKEKGKDAEWTFAVDPKTKIKKGGKDVSAADLKPGDSVQVRYMDHDGKTVAQSINVLGGSTAKKVEEKR